MAETLCLATFWDLIHEKFSKYFFVYGLQHSTRSKYMPSFWPKQIINFSNSFCCRRHNVYRIKIIRSQIIKTITNCPIHIVNFNTRKGLIANWRGGGGFHTSFGSSKSDPRPLSFLYLNVEFFGGKTFFLLLRGSLTMRLRIDEHKSFFFFKQETT